MASRLTSKRNAMIDMDFDNGADTTTALANHLFGKLATSPVYTIDKTLKNKGNKCGCNDESYELTGQYGDTSIGNPEVWHGNVTLLIKDEVVVESLEDDQECSDGKAQMKNRTCSDLSRNAQLVAETIVFSFLQKKRHPERSNFLTTCIGIAKSCLVIMLYDSEHGVLLESSLIPLMSATCSNKFSVDAILVTWLALNYKYLCTGLTEEMLHCKANFFEQAKKTIDVQYIKIISQYKM
uniref:Uncharacterized protein LOC111138078 n=1 Tax=Crassostrea virginica TaxID=6565 RepID=A0A8B8F004_CRAVI|nr:uncharacterized protein LOC111138078 [Crassostrea virginica]